MRALNDKGCAADRYKVREIMQNHGLYVIYA